MVKNLPIPALIDFIIVSLDIARYILHYNYYRKVRLEVYNEEKRENIYNVVGTIPGEREPGKYREFLNVSFGTIGFYDKKLKKFQMQLIVHKFHVCVRRCFICNWLIALQIS